MLGVGERGLGGLGTRVVDREGDGKEGEGIGVLGKKRN